MDTYAIAVRVFTGCSEQWLKELRDEYGEYQVGYILHYVMEIVGQWKDVKKGFLFIAYLVFS